MTRRQYEPASPIGSQPVPAGPATAGDISAIRKALQSPSDSFATGGYSMSVAGMERGRPRCQRLHQMSLLKQNATVSFCYFRRSRCNHPNCMRRSAPPVSR